MKDLVLTVSNGQAVVSSRQVAEDFGKEHKHVLDSIREILAVENSAANLFYKATYENRGKQYPEYLMNRDGFTLLAMSFTGKPAMQWKLKYIAAFNAMEAKLSNNSALPQNFVEALKALVTSEESRIALEAKVSIMEPKAKAFDIFIDSKGYYSVGTVGKMFDIGRNRLFEILRNAGILMKKGNIPLQTYVNRGYFAVKGNNVVYVSPKGVQWLSENIPGLSMPNNATKCHRVIHGTHQGGAPCITANFQH